MLNIAIPNNMQELSPKITVIGVGGAGGNAVNNMIESNLEGVDFVVANTDGQALANSIANRKIQLGLNVTKGLGAGSMPDIGKSAAEESIDDIISELNDSNMVFITAGLGGGTGTGAAPIIAKSAKEKGILTVCVVTKPFEFEGSHRKRVAEEGIQEIQKYADTLIVIPNQNLFRLANEKTGFAEAFSIADNVLHKGVCGVTDLMVKPGMINLDFADIRTVMSEMGKAMMGTGEATGENRAIEAADSAINNPLLDETSMKGAKAILINITGGNDMTLFEVDEAANRIRKEIDPNANIIFGSALDKNIDGVIRVSLVATGISKIENSIKEENSSKVENEVHTLYKKEKHEYFAPDNDSRSFEEKSKESFTNLNNFDESINHISNNENKINTSDKVETDNINISVNNEIEINEANKIDDNLELNLEEKLNSDNTLETFIPNQSSDVSEIDNTESFILKLDSYSKEKENLKSDNNSIINRISGFWSKKNNDIKNSNHQEPTLENTDKIENIILKENDDNNLNINMEDQQNKALEIPAFLRRQVN
ncbi:MAG: cell division protein FtsZ [Candidatus Puniceispirillales bacterium]